MRHRAPARETGRYIQNTDWNVVALTEARATARRRRTLVRIELVVHRGARQRDVRVPCPDRPHEHLERVHDVLERLSAAHPEEPGTRRKHACVPFPCANTPMDPNATGSPSAQRHVYTKCNLGGAGPHLKNLPHRSCSETQWASLARAACPCHPRARPGRILDTTRRARRGLQPPQPQLAPRPACAFAPQCAPLRPCSLRGGSGRR